MLLRNFYSPQTNKMIEVKKEGIILQKTELEFESEGVLNPGIYQEGNTVHVFYRAVRKGNFSTVGYARLDGPLHVVQRNTEPLLSPTTDEESQGIEDPRVVKIDATYYMSYCAYDGMNAAGAYATSKDLVSFQNEGIITPQISYREFQKLTSNCGKLNCKYQRFHLEDKVENDMRKIVYLWDKNLVFFPRKINGKFTFLHRIKPDIQLVSVSSLSGLTKGFWDEYFANFNQHIVMSSKYEHEIGYIGGGCPPVETEAGWLMIYHGVRDTANGYSYSACAALLDIDDPRIEIARLPYALFSPDLKWELEGYVNNVVFPTGTALFDGILYVYYGAADDSIAVASVELQALISELLKHKE